MNTNFADRFTGTRSWLMRGSVALLAAGALAVATPRANAGVFLSVNIAPPPLPVYVQPPIPAPGYIWTPGYWAYDEDGGYYWVPGTWVEPPYYGALWTPGYWGWGGGVYLFHPGYWGRHVGFYGGIDYGFGYVGIGYVGGYWGHGGFYYNRPYNRITNVNITNVYNKTVVVNRTDNHYSFNGPGGAQARPTAQQVAFQREQHTGPLASQEQQRTLASRDRSLRAAVNHGAPPIAATSRPGAFNGQHVVAARGATARAESLRADSGAHGGNAERPGALRSAGFAPHANGMRSHDASAEQRGVARSNEQPRDSNFQRAPRANHEQAPRMDRQAGPPQERMQRGQDMQRPQSMQRGPEMQGPRMGPQPRPQGQRGQPRGEPHPSNNKDPNDHNGHG